MKNIKMIISVVIILLPLSGLLAQSTTVFLDKSNTGYNLLLIEKDSKIDTIHKFAFDAQLLDYIIIGQNEVLAIIESPIVYLFYQFEYINDEWRATLSTGQIASNYKILSYQDPKIIIHQPISETFRIVNQDKIEYETVDGLIKYVDVKTIKERRKNR